MIAGLLGGCVLTAAAATATSEGRVLIADTSAELPDFELTDQDGRPFRFSALNGANALVFFGFTHCPDVCPATMFKLRQLEESLRSKETAMPQVVMISVDGERDTPAALKTYLEPISRNFVGLTGDPKLVRRIAAGFSAVFFKGLPGDESGQYLVEHTSQVYLVDPDGRLRATFFEASVEQMSEVVQGVGATAN